MAIIHYLEPLITLESNKETAGMFLVSICKKNNPATTESSSKIDH